jgi:hypothetical protein
VTAGPEGASGDVSPSSSTPAATPTAASGTGTPSPARAGPPVGSTAQPRVRLRSLIDPRGLLRQAVAGLISEGTDGGRARTGGGDVSAGAKPGRESRASGGARASDDAKASASASPSSTSYGTILLVTAEWAVLRVASGRTRVEDLKPDLDRLAG